MGMSNKDTSLKLTDKSSYSGNLKHFCTQAVRKPRVPPLCQHAAVTYARPFEQTRSAWVKVAIQKLFWSCQNQNKGHGSWCVQNIEVMCPASIARHFQQRQVHRGNYNFIYTSRFYKWFSINVESEQPMNDRLVSSTTFYELSKGLNRVCVY